jgi:hypothetical protein
MAGERMKCGKILGDAEGYDEFKVSSPVVMVWT